MGHQADPNKYATYRDATVLQQRIATFVLVFSFIIVALVMTFSAVLYREAPCQDRADEIELDLRLRSGLTSEGVLTALRSILEERGGWLDFPLRNDDAPTKVQLDILDTDTRFIAGRGFRLVRRNVGSNYHFGLSTVFDKLCGTHPTLSMQVMANVDYERVAYHIKALGLMNSTVKYLQRSSLTTKDRNRLTTMAQLQSVFPGFHQLAPASASLSPTLSMNYTVEGVSDVYYNGRPLDIRVALQRWFPEKGSSDFLRVVVSTHNIMAERDLLSLYTSIQKAFVAQNMLCNASSPKCAAPLDLYIR
ncbi:hypothetical protein JKF63_01954 [Porcisia hertigi]|uniref:Uncharacterized protein n=1 Tax=Porcisia hertigi TaxID=2761500 RepID=A0A836L0V2_9TRYP|nr:hypothetical protein JKF63_01954 [Porcisia hertigi]